MSSAVTEVQDVIASIFERLFAKWLEERYQTIENLNEKWGERILEFKL